MIKLNGKERKVSPGTTVEQMLLAEGFTLQRIAVERTGIYLKW